jgi:hypothetical protein
MDGANVVFAAGDHSSRGRLDMLGQHNVGRGEPVEQSIIDHVLGTASELLGGLEDRQHGAGPPGSWHPRQRPTTNDQRPITAHDYAAHAADEALPGRVRSLLTRRATATDRRRRNYQVLQAEERTHKLDPPAPARQASMSRARDQGIEL